MVENKKIKKYDKYNRPIYYELKEPNIIYEFKYFKNLRLTKITSPEIKGNDKTLTLEEKKDNKYITRISKENGEIYDVLINYDLNGKEIKMIRVNKIINSVYEKRTFRDKNGNSLIWVDKYNKEYNIGFKIDKSLLK